MKVCRICYTASPDSAKTCQACGKKLEASSTGGSDWRKSALTGAVVLLIAGLAIFYHTHLALLYRTATEGNADTVADQPVTANSPSNLVPTETPTVPPPTTAAPHPVKMAPASLPPANLTVSQSSDSIVEKKASPLARFGPKPRKRLGHENADTAEILRGNPGITAMRTGEDAATRYNDLVQKTVFEEFAKNRSEGQATTEETYVIVVRIDLEFNQFELVGIPSWVSADVKNRWAVAVSKCSGTVLCPKELREKWGHSIDVRFYVGKKP